MIMSQTKVDKAIITRIMIFSAIAAFTVITTAVIFRALLVPVLIALFIAYLLQPVVQYLMQRWKWSRFLAVIFSMGAVFLMIIGAVAGIIPVVQIEIRALMEIAPHAKELLLMKFLPWTLDQLQQFGFEFGQIRWRDLNFNSQLSHASGAIQHIFSQTSTLFGGIVTAALVPVFLFFILIDYIPISLFLFSLVPLDLRPVVVSFTEQVDRTLRSVLKRQLAVAVILAILYAIGFSIVGLKFSLAVGLIAGICRLVPYMDVVAAILLSSIIIVTEPGMMGWVIPIGITCVIFTIQILDGVWITPRVVGDSVGLPTAVVIASIIAFADWLGFVGILVAIPVAAILKIVLVAGLKAYLSSNYFEAKE
jgi:predicted PurR-regulated permease PerM